MKYVSEEQFVAMKTLADNLVDAGRAVRFNNGNFAVEIRNCSKKIKIVAENLKKLPALRVSVTIGVSYFKKMNYEEFCELTNRTVNVVE